VWWHAQRREAVEEAGAETVRQTPASGQEPAIDAALPHSCS